MQRATETVQRILEAHHHLRLHPELTSSEKYEVFRKLENLVDDDVEKAQSVLHDPRVEAVQRFLRKNYLNCIYQLEVDWVRSFLSSPQRFIENDYIKYEQYRLRAFFEYYCFIMVANRKPKRSLFIGCGPFPLTSIIMSSNFDISIDYLDKRAEALYLAENLLKRIRLNKSPQFFQAEAESFSKIEEYDAIFVAGSVGETKEEKGRIIQHLCGGMKKGQVLMLRPPYLLEKLLIPEIDLPSLTDMEVYTLQLSSEEDIVYRFLIRKP